MIALRRFDTGILDHALKKQRESFEKERRRLLDVVCETLKERQREYNIQAAYIFGSLITPHRWYPFSDVDVAVRGCSTHLLSIMKDIEEATGRSVDVVDLDRHPFPDLFLRKGIKIYG